MHRLRYLLGVSVFAISSLIVRETQTADSQTVGPPPGAQCAGLTTVGMNGGLCIAASQTSVSAGTSVTLTAYTDADLQGTLFLGIAESSGRVITTCVAGQNTCTAQVSQASAQSKAYVAQLYDPTSTIPIVQSPSITVTWSGGGPTCGRTLGQACAAVWTDKDTYQIGDSIQICFSVPQPSHATITLTRPDGSSNVVYDQDDDGTGGCFAGGQTGPPAGDRHLHLAVTLNGTAIAQADDTYTVTGGSGGLGCAPHCQVSITTDKPSYYVGEPIQLCVALPSPGQAQITDIDAAGHQQSFTLAADNGQACITPTASEPTGTEHVHLDAYIGGVLAGTADASFQVTEPPIVPTPQPPTCSSVPGGTWVAPPNGTVTTGSVHFEAHAYPSSTCAPIREVDFTAWWAAVGPKSGPWVTLCRLSAPIHDDVYACDVNLAQWNAPAGPISISFDVYDQAGKSNLSPNGEHTIQYAPVVPTVTPIPPQPTPTAAAPQSTPTPTPAPQTSWSLRPPFTGSCRAVSPDFWPTKSSVGKQQQATNRSKGFAGVLTAIDNQRGYIGYRAYTLGLLTGGYNPWNSNSKNHPDKQADVTTCMRGTITPHFAGRVRITATIHSAGGAEVDAGANWADLLGEFISHIKFVGYLGQIGAQKLLPRSAANEGTWAFLRVPALRKETTQQYHGVFGVYDVPFFPDKMQVSYSGEKTVLSLVVPVHSGQPLVMEAGLRSQLKSWGNGASTVNLTSSRVQAIVVQKIP